MITLYSQADESRNDNFYCREMYAHGDAEGFMEHDILTSPKEVIFTNGLHVVELCNPKGVRIQAFMLGNDFRAIKIAAEIL